MKLIAAALFLVAWGPMQAQSKWEHTVVPDELHAQTLDVFTLAGEYVSRPNVTKIPFPLIVVRCSKEKMREGYLKSGFAYPISDGRARVDMRLDERKPSTDWWGISDGGDTLFFNRAQLLKLMTGSMIGHASDADKRAQKVLLGVEEVGAGTEYEMRFTMPSDVRDLVLECGLEYDRKKRAALEGTTH